MLRYVARHGFFSALLMPGKPLLVGFKYTEGAQPLTFVPAPKETRNLLKISNVDIYSGATLEYKSEIRYSSTPKNVLRNKDQHMSVFSPSV